MIERYLDFEPRIHPQAYVHPSAVVIGDVALGAGTSVWPGSVLRGDQGRIEVGAETSLQDGVIAHATRGTSTTTVGDRCVVGHRAVLHGCTVEDDVLVGMGAILLDNCHIGRFSIIGAGAVVSVGTRIPARSLVLGVPGRVVRSITDAEIDAHIRHGHGEYMRLCAEYRQRDGLD
ncbi:MAG: gamma carbonic anhydrase family protein [Deltaproteobacteria bacterium]|nr:MAG: gamma carbonic anhydrase family protein [Deltaproteobacteria bacterium]